MRSSLAVGGWDGGRDGGRDWGRDGGREPPSCTGDEDLEREGVDEVEGGDPAPSPPSPSPSSVSRAYVPGASMLPGGVPNRDGRLEGGSEGPTVLAPTSAWAEASPKLLPPTAIDPSTKDPPAEDPGPWVSVSYVADSMARLFKPGGAPSSPESVSNTKEGEGAPGARVVGGVPRDREDRRLGRSRMWPAPSGGTTRGVPIRSMGDPDRDSSSEDRDGSPMSRLSSPVPYPSLTYPDTPSDSVSSSL